MKNSIEQKAVNTIRGLSIDAIEKAGSGHPGLPLGAAPMAYILWSKHFKSDPDDPQWIDRDRFVLSAGHGSALLYSMLYLFGYELPLEEIKNFRQWGSKTPGHPEFRHTPGVETTTGPLGQGIANAVGMAVSEKFMSQKFNTDEIDIIDHYTYCLVGDGCLMEGISYEAAAVAGYLNLGKLIMLYDSNDISLDGPTSLTFTEDIEKRFSSSGWQVIKVDDGDTDLASINKAVEEAKNEDNRPSIIIVKTTIGYGSPNKAGSEKAHGSPLGEDETKLTKEKLGLEPDKKFYVDEDVKKHFGQIKEKMKSGHISWDEKYTEYSKKYPQKAGELNSFYSQELPELDSLLPVFSPGDDMATRVSNNKVLNIIAEKIGWIVGLDADLSCSTKAFIKEGEYFDATKAVGRNIRMGVREHAMAGIANGISCHGGLRPFTSTFFSFVDYMRPSVRLAALSGLDPVYIFTHDSIAVGEDGPTHQPVEQLMSVRIIPGLKAIRPADANEVAQAWKYILKSKNTPFVLVLSRQNIPTLDREKYASAEGLEKGAYILNDVSDPDVLILATGSEVGLAVDSAADLDLKGIKARVISMPSFEIFDQQPESYREEILPASIKMRISIEAGTTFGWQKYTGGTGLNIGVDRFGSSAPGGTVMDKYGFNKGSVVKKIIAHLKK